MKIAFVNTSWQLGGAETVARQLMDGCAAAGHETRFYVAAGKTYPRRADLVPLYPRLLSRVYHTRFHSLVESIAPRRAWTDQRFRLLAAGWPDLIHVHNFHGDYASVEALAYVARREPLVWTFHGHWGVTGGCDHPLDCTRYRESCGSCPRLGVWPLGRVDDTAEQLQLKLELLGHLQLDVVAPSRLLASRIQRSRVGKDWRVHHIPNGVSTTAFSGARKFDDRFRQALALDPSRATILVVNRNFRDEEKGFSLVREALVALDGRSRAVQVVLAGHDSEWAAAQLPAHLNAVNAGYVESRSKMAALFEAAEVFLFASPAENFPCVVLEAMASECCVVATPTSGVVEQIEDGRNGMLASDVSGQSLGRTLQAALSNPDRSRDFGRAARDRVRSEFSTDVFIERHLKLYDSVAVVHRGVSVPASMAT